MCYNFIIISMDLKKDIKCTFVAQLQRSHMDLECLQQEKAKNVSSARDKSPNSQVEIVFSHYTAAKAYSEQVSDFAYSKNS